VACHRHRARGPLDLDTTPPELVEDIMERGMVSAAAVRLLAGLDQLHRTRNLDAGSRG